MTAALPLLISHAEGICADKVDGVDNNNGHTGQVVEAEENEEEEDPWRMPVLVDNGPAWSGGYFSSINRSSCSGKKPAAIAHEWAELSGAVIDRWRRAR